MENIHNIVVALNCYETHREASRRYYLKNRDKLREKQMAYYREKNPEVKTRGRKPKPKPEPKVMTEIAIQTD